MGRRGPGPRVGPGTVTALLIFAWGMVAGPPAAAAPFAFRDDYTTTMAVAAPPTTAMVLTTPPGVVRLPYAPFQAAFDPSGSYVLVAGPGGVQAYVSDGAGVHAIADWRLGGIDATGVTWLADGLAFAVATPAGLTVYGLSAQAGTRLATQAAGASSSGGTLLAPGPSSLRSAVLLATADGATLWTAVGTRMIPLSGGPGGLEGNVGVAATSDGGVAATWTREAVELWAWDGAAYRRASAWDPPSASQPIQAVAFFPQGGGYWVVTSAGNVSAFAYGAAGLQSLPQWSLQAGAAPDPPITIAAGWAAGALAVVYPSGWTYWDVPGGGALAPDAARSLNGQTWPVYVPSALLESTVLWAGHPVTALRVEDADCLAGQAIEQCQQPAIAPPGTSIAYAVSTDGCVTWTPAPLWTNVGVPAGTALCYVLMLSTTDPTATPIVDVTNLYEIAAESEAARLPSLLCTGACP